MVLVGGRGVAMPIWGFPTWPWLPICSAPSATPTSTTIDCLPRIIFLHSSVSSVGWQIISCLISVCPFFICRLFSCYSLTAPPPQATCLSCDRKCKIAAALFKTHSSARISRLVCFYRHVASSVFQSVDQNGKLPRMIDKMIGSMYYSWQFDNLIKWMRYSGKQWNIMAMTIVLQVQCHLLVQHEEVHVNAIIWVSAALDLVERWPLARVSHVTASWLWMALMKLLWVRGGYPHPPTHKPARYAGHMQKNTHWGLSGYLECSL